MSSTHRPHRQAFTLIELLVVVAIIAVLIAILIPSLSKAREEARRAKCGAGLRQWGSAAYSYTTANNGILPSKGGDGVKVNYSGSTVGDWSDMSLWFNALPSQMNGGLSYYELQQQDFVSGKWQKNLPTSHVNSIFICPSAGNPQGVLNTNGNGQIADTMWVDGFPNAGASEGDYFAVYGSVNSLPPTPPSPYPSGRPYLNCYQWNSKMVTKDPNANGYNSNQPDDSTVNNTSLSITTLAKSANLVMMSERRIRQDELLPNDPDNPSAQIDSAFNYYYYPLCQPKGAWQRFTTRHFNGGNVLFIDGRVEYLRYHDVVTPTLSPAGANNNIADWNQPSRLVWNPRYSAR
jgi:prepilin-type N-terminal cleavage/methylation domain-containing protein/prepilin-type processing-associated H-X9-DG protein